jgi:hypothetical protein
MLRIAFIVCMLVLARTTTFAADLLDSDSGTYAIQKLAPPDTFYRLSRTSSGWKMEVKNAVGQLRQQNNPWQDLSCGGGCEFRTAGPEELAEYFPADLRPRQIRPMGGGPGTDVEWEVACIQNATLAWCKFKLRGFPDNQASYVVIDLGTRVTTPIVRKTMPVFEQPFLVSVVDLNSAQDVGAFRQELQLIAQSEGARFADLSARSRSELDNPRLTAQAREDIQKWKSLTASRPIISFAVFRNDGVHLQVMNIDLPGYPVRLLFFEHSTEARTAIDARGFANRVVARLGQRWRVANAVSMPSGGLHHGSTSERPDPSLPSVR